MLGREIPPQKFSSVVKKTGHFCGHVTSYLKTVCVQLSFSGQMSVSVVLSARRDPVLLFHLPSFPRISRINSAGGFPSRRHKLLAQCSSDAAASPRPAPCAPLPSVRSKEEHLCLLLGGSSSSLLLSRLSSSSFLLLCSSKGACCVEVTLSSEHSCREAERERDFSRGRVRRR